MLNSSTINDHSFKSCQIGNSSVINGITTNMIIINCASNSTLQDLKIPKSSGVYTYLDSDDLNSITSNRHIVWQTSDDILDLSEHSLNRDLHHNELQIQFKNSLILQNGVTIHETADKIVILVTTIVSTHRLIFPHPKQMYSTPSSFGTLSCLGPSLSSSTISPCYSIFYNVSFDDLDANFVQLQNSFSQNAVLGSPAILPYLASCSWIDDVLDAHFILSTTNGSLQIIRLPSANNEDSEIKIQNFDLKQNNLIGKLFNGIVPSLISSNKISTIGNEAAINLLAFHTHDDNLLFALCRDGRIRVISLRHQSILYTHDLFNQPKESSNEISKNQTIPTQKPVSMKFWFDENEAMFPNLVIYVTDTKYSIFYFYQFIMPNLNSSGKNHSISSFNSINQNEPHMNFLFQRIIPSHYELLDYFVHHSQLWAMWQQDEIINLQYCSIDTNNESDQPFEWTPVIADVNAYPEIGLRSSLVNPREYYINEIFWRGNFSLKTISKAIAVLNRNVGDDKFSANKIDVLIQEAVKLIDNIIRNQAANNLEMSMEEYIKHEIDAWNKLYQFCLDYHVTENEPMSIFVDNKTGIKGIVRKARLEFISSLSPFDDMINQYFLHCKQNHSLIHQEKQNGNAIRTNTMIESLDLFSISAFEYRLNVLMKPLKESINQTNNSLTTIVDMKCSILALLHGMSEINATLKDKDLLDFEAFMQQMSSFSTKTNLSLADITKKITEDFLLPEMPSLSDNSLVPLIDDFFEKCPCVVEAIKYCISQISFDFMPKSDINQFIGSNNDNQIFISGNNENLQLEMQDALQFEINSMFTNLLRSRYGLEFTVTSITRIIQMRYKFCRDLFLFQYLLTSFHSKIKSDYKSKIIHEVQSSMIPSTSQLLFVLNHLNWICEAPMITPNLWWSKNTHSSGLTTIVNMNTSTSTISSTNRNGGASFTNSELLSVLEMRDYINLNRVGLLTHESIFYDAYPKANILYFFIQFSGEILAKRILTYTLKWEYDHGTLDQSTIFGDGIGSYLIPSYMNSICQLLWPFSSGQFKLAEFLLSVGQYHLVERYVDKLHPWCTIFSYSRFFAKAVCYLMTGDGAKAISHFKQSVFGINSEPFLFKIFAQKPKTDKMKEMQIKMTSDEQNGDWQEKADLADLEMSLRKFMDSNINSYLNARTIFRYYNKLIQLFNRYSTPDHVIELADCALKSLKKESDPEYDQHHSSLQSILFTCHLRLGNIDQAYNAMIDNTDEDQKQNCLRQFIVNLCENGKFKELVSYPYIGLDENFVSILESKARSSCIRRNSSFDTASPRDRKEISNENESVNYYQILYSYFMNTFNYKRAAQAIYDYYRQLSQEFDAKNDSSLRTQAEALLIARNCLKCLDDPKYSWIVKNSFNRNDSKQSQLKRKRGYFADDDQNYNEKAIVEVVDVDDLLREHELISARIKLLDRDPKEYAMAKSSLSPEETMILCINASLFEQAFKIAELYKLKLEPIFEGMAYKYVQLLNGAFNRRRIDEEMMLNLIAETNLDIPTFESEATKLPIDDNNFTMELFDVFYENTASNTECDFICYSQMSICDRMWFMIMYYLYKYELQPKISSNYFKIVTEKLLSNGVMIPVSLLNIYKKSNCPELIRFLMTYNFLPEATQISIDYMKAFIGYGVEYFDIENHLYPKCRPLCIPLHIFDCLLKILNEENKNQQKLLMDSDLYSSIRNDTDSVAVDDDLEDFKSSLIDFSMLIQNLSSIKDKLEKTIASCSK